MSVPPSFIKNIAFQISGHYKLDNTPFSVDERDKKIAPFIGRKRQYAKFLEFLNGTSKRGVFLVTGYRGMGKTSFVNYVVRKYRMNDENELPRTKRKKKQIIPIHLTLAQNKPKELDILRLLVNSVHDHYKSYRLRNVWRQVFNSTLKTKYYFVKLLLLPLVVLLAYLLSQQEGITVAVAGQYVWKVFFPYLLLLAIFKFSAHVIEKSTGPHNRIRRLMESCYAQLSEESSNNDEVNIPYIKAKFTEGEKRTKQYPIADTKQIEYELQEFLRQVSEKGLEFIFIFDELDKVDPVFSASYMYEDLETFEARKAGNAYERDMRERKQAIINIIASLKNFFTTADARFVFIAGREMFDASLADVADRQSSISSIFTYVFNIESLLKETHLKDSNGNNDANNASLSNAVESYLKELLFAKDAPRPGWRARFKRPALAPDAAGSSSTLYEMVRAGYNWLPPEEGQVTDPDRDHAKRYFTLQNFVLYLTYRSNGSPQKLIKAIHDFIIVKRDFDTDGGKNLVYRLVEPTSSGLYLYFNYYDQYRIGFISYLYRPFLIRYGRKFKLYSDNIIVSTPYLFDHLLKFHPFAFSLSNLEMVPEVLSPTKTPSLREHIRQIIDHLGANHLREAELSLFDYKFYSRTLNEIAFLSKIFETEAAAFNFTLDESFLIKLHVRNKIKELRSIYSKFSGGSEAYRQIFSIAHLNEILGDLDFFDQEYDDAITSYSDAIKPLSNMSEGIQELNMQDFITLIKNKLKVGLCFEKFNAYEEALAMYSDCCQDAKKFMSYRLLNGTPVETPWPVPEKINKDFSKVVFYSSALSDVLQIVLQGFMSKIFIQEKMGVEGISDMKLCIALGGFLKLAGGFVTPEKRNHVLKANAFLFAGKLLYFKNNPWGFQIKKDLNEKELILPEPYYSQITALIGRLSFLHEGNHARTRRKPVVALAMYIMGVYEIMSVKSQDSLIAAEINGYLSWKLFPRDTNIVRLVFDDLEARLGSDPESLNGVHYRYLATLLSNIGDCLLSLYRVGKDKFSAFGVAEVFKNLGDEPGTHPFNHFLNPVDKHFDLADVLRAYHLSGLYFDKYGRKSSCTFQFNKILYVLRMVLQADTPDERFLKIIRIKIVIPALELINETSGNSEAHMLHKALDQGAPNKTFAINNISYHPESRETVLLYYYLGIKLGDHSQDIKQLIASDNSFGTQYSRMMELDFYAKHVYEIELKAILTAKAGEALVTPEVKISIVNYLFTRFTMLRILEIYGFDYSLGYRFLAYTHYKVAKVIDDCRKHGIDLKERAIGGQLKEYLGESSYASLDALYHYQKSKDLYEKTVQLHTGGMAYKKMINELIYLEDDFNDDAYHFGAALDKYLLINDVLALRIDECTEIIIAAEQYHPELYLNEEEPAA